jgi:hypothetical protein
MSGNGRPTSARIEILDATASESETAAITAAIERFLADTAPPPPAPPPTSRSAWLEAALREGVSNRDPRAPDGSGLPAPRVRDRTRPSPT